MKKSQKRIVNCMLDLERKLKYFCYKFLYLFLAIVLRNIDTARQFDVKLRPQCIRQYFFLIFVSSKSTFVYY